MNLGLKIPNTIVLEPEPRPHLPLTLQGSRNRSTSISPSKGAVKGAFPGESTANPLVDGVDRADADIGHFSGFGGWEIHNKQV